MKTFACFSGIRRLGALPGSLLMVMATVVLAVTMNANPASAATYSPNPDCLVTYGSAGGPYTGCVQTQNGQISASVSGYTTGWSGSNFNITVYNSSNQAVVPSVDVVCQGQSSCSEAWSLPVGVYHGTMYFSAGSQPSDSRQIDFTLPVVSATATGSCQSIAVSVNVPDGSTPSATIYPYPESTGSTVSLSNQGNGTWTGSLSEPNNRWYSVAVSADGVTLNPTLASNNAKYVSGNFIYPGCGELPPPQPSQSANDCSFRSAATGITAVGSGGFLTVDSIGQVCARGTAVSYGDPSNLQLAAPIIAITATPDGGGYWLLGADGGVFTYGDARFYGSTGGMRLNAPVVGMAPTQDGNGYWLVAKDGGVFSFGDARFYGSTGNLRLNKPVNGMAVAPGGNGYWLVALDGGVFTFTNDGFYGSLGNTQLAAPIIGMSGTPDGKGYTLVGSDGGVFCFGDSHFYGSWSGSAPGSVVAIATVASNNGYYLLTSNDHTKAFGPGAQAPTG